MAKKSAGEKSDRRRPTISIRFHPAEVRRMQAAADEVEVLRSTWIKEVALARADLILSSGRKLEPLSYHAVGGPSEQIVVRVSPVDYDRIRRAAAREKFLVGPWVRAEVSRKLGAAEAAAKTHAAAAMVGERASEQKRAHG